jgi:ParB family transcriptional regulator, chromosome partitioning protein
VSSKADKLGVGASFGRAPGISARRAAIAAVTDAPTDGVVKQSFRLDIISHNPDNPREELRNIQEMADTLESVGQTTAITLATVQAYLKDRPERAGELEPGAQYVVVDGHRRLAGARLLKWDAIRAIIDDAQVASDERLLEAAFVANTQRDDMTDLEQAEALKRLVAFHGSQAKTAKRLGVSQGLISQRLSLLALSPELQADLNAGRRSVEHLRGLARLDAEEQKIKADERAAASEARAQAKRAERSAQEPAAERSTAPGETYYAVIGDQHESPKFHVPDQPPEPQSEPHPGAAALPAQSAPLTRETAKTQSVAPAGEAPKPAKATKPSQPVQAVPGSAEPMAATAGDSDALKAARQLVDRFTREERRLIVSFLQEAEANDEHVKAGTA